MTRKSVIGIAVNEANSVPYANDLCFVVATSSNTLVFSSDTVVSNH